MPLLLLALLFLPAAAQDLPKDPIDRNLVMSEEEQRGAEELDKTQDLLQQLDALRKEYLKDADLARYGKEREPLVRELWYHFERLMNVRTDIKRMHLSAAIVNLLSVGSDLRDGKTKRAGAVAGTRMVQFTRVFDFDKQLQAAQGRVGQALKDEAAFFSAEQEGARQRKRLTVLAAAGLLALAAGGTFLFFRLRRKA